MLFASPVVATHELKYGTQHVHRAYAWQDGPFTNYKQESSYVSKETGSVEWVELAAASSTDLSAQHTRDAYDAVCGGCYLNMAHTEERHALELKKAGK